MKFTTLAAIALITLSAEAIQLVKKDDAEDLKTKKAEGDLVAAADATKAAEAKKTGDLKKAVEDKKVEAAADAVVSQKDLNKGRLEGYPGPTEDEKKKPEPVRIADKEPATAEEKKVAKAQEKLMDEEKKEADAEQAKKDKPVEVPSITIVGARSSESKEVHSDAEKYTANMPDHVITGVAKPAAPIVEKKDTEAAAKTEKVGAPAADKTAADSEGASAPKAEAAPAAADAKK